MEGERLYFRRKLSEFLAKIMLSEDESGVESLIKFIEDAVKKVVVQGIRKRNYAYVVQKLKEIEEDIDSVLLTPENKYKVNLFMTWVLNNLDGYAHVPAEWVAYTVAVNYIVGVLRGIEMVRSAFRSIYLEKEKKE